MTSPLFQLKRKLQSVRRFSTTVKDSPFVNYPRRLSYAHGTSELPLLSEHVSERLRNITKKYPNNRALISNHQQIEWTYEELNERVDQVAKGLIAIGLQKGDRIGIYSPNKAEWTLLQFAAARADLILVNVNPAFQQSELKYCLQQVGIKTLVIAERFKSSDYVKIVKDVVPALEYASNPLDLGKFADFPELKNVILIGDTEVKGMLNFKDLEKIYTQTDAEQLYHRERAINFEDATNIQFTSGTTGYPKGATLSHFNILNNSMFNGHFMELTDKDKVCIPVPLYHCFGMVIGNLAALNYGAAMVYPSEAFDPVSTLETISKHKCTAVYGVPTMFISYLEEYAKNKQKYNVKSLRTGFIAGSSCPEALMNRISEEFGIQNLTQGYGMTETSPVITISHKDDSKFKKATTVGRTGPHVEIKIAHPETHQILPWGEPGEVCARGYAVMKGYWGDEKKTKDSIIDGWMHTGDLGQIDDDGFIKIIGRSKDLIIRGGENIYPREIEEFLMKHPNVADAQVIGVNDEFFGEEVCAWIKLKEAGKTKHQDFFAYCQGQIAHYKVPRYVRFVTEFPLTITGKVKKNEMRHIANELMTKKDSAINDIVEIKSGKKQK